MDILESFKVLVVVSPLNKNSVQDVSYFLFFLTFGKRSDRSSVRTHVCVCGFLSVTLKKRPGVDMNGS